MKLLEENLDAVAERKFGCSCWTEIGKDVVAGRGLEGTFIGRGVVDVVVVDCSDRRLLEGTSIGKGVVVVDCWLFRLTSIGRDVDRKGRHLEGLLLIVPIDAVVVDCSN